MDQQSVLRANIKRNIGMWQKWEEHGVTSATLLVVDFFFITHSRKAKDALIHALADTNTKIDVYEKRRALLFKSFNIQLTFPQQTWSLEKLQEKTQYLWEIGFKADPDLILDGNGASMPQ